MQVSGKMAKSCNKNDFGSELLVTSLQYKGLLGRAKTAGVTEAGIASPVAAEPGISSGAAAEYEALPQMDGLDDNDRQISDVYCLVFTRGIYSVDCGQRRARNEAGSGV